MKYRFTAVLLLVMLAWLELSTLAVTTPTVDEPLHIMRGYAFVARDEERYRMYGPVLADALSGIPLLLEPDLQFPPADDPFWLGVANMEHADKLIRANDASLQRIFFLARFPIIAVSLLLGAFIFRWARERSGAPPALGALLLYVFCPNLLAHSRLAATDAATASTFLISAYAFSRSLESPRFMTRAASGAALGLALATKFSAVALLVAFIIEATLRALRDRRRAAVAAIAGTLGVTVAIGALTVWAVYRFRVDSLETGGVPVPAPYYWREWQALNEYLQDPLPGYLFGELSPRGWWYYYPIAFLVKTPLPLQLFLLLSVADTLRRRVWIRDMSLYLVPGLFFAALLFSPHALGYRYLLPVLPFIFVLSADVIAAAQRMRWSQFAIGALLIWQVWGTLRIYPYYLPFFNEIVGGSDRGRYILSDSNIDWGQDLIGLKYYVDHNHLERINLSYFGVIHPTAYGLNAEPLPPVLAAMQDQGGWQLRMLYPSDPAPGTYAISVMNLMGNLATDRSVYAFFRDRKPDAIIGGSIYVYTVSAHGEPTDLMLSGLQVDRIDPETFSRLGTNDVRLRWSDASAALIAPPGYSWIAIADRTAPAENFARFFDGIARQVRTQTTGGRSYNLYRLDLGDRILEAAGSAERSVAWNAEVHPDPTATPTAELPAQFGEVLELLGYTLTTDTPSGEAHLLTYWRVLSPISTPLWAFAHAVGQQAQIVAQEDRWDAAPKGWRPGDLIVQLHRLAIPPGSGPVWIEVGLHNPESGERLPAIVDGREVDRRLLLKYLTPQDAPP